MQTLPKHLITRYETAIWQHREQWRSFLDDAYRYINPNRNMWRQSRTEGTRENIRTYDITAPLAARTFVSQLHATLTPPFQRWAEYESGSDVPEAEVEQNNQELQELTNLLFKYYRQSNIDLSLAECYADLVFGTAVLKIDEGPSDEKPFIFSCVPTSLAAFEESTFGDIRTVWQQFGNLKLRDIEAMWPDATLPEELEQNAKREPELDIPVNQGVVFNEASGDYTNYVFLDDQFKVIWEQPLESSPFVVFRWSKLPGETLGRGVAQDVMPTVLTLNKMVEFMFRASELSLAPPLMAASDNVFNPNNLRLRPNTIISVGSLMGGAPLQPLDIKPNLQLAQLEITSLQSWINKAFFAEPFGEINAPTKTATEIAARQQLLLEEIGSAFGRLEVELLSKTIDRSTFILKKKGLFPDVTVNGKDIRLKYLSPLARLQDTADLKSFQQAVLALEQIYGEQLTFGALNNAEVPTWIATKSGAPLELFKTSDQMEAVIQNMLQAAQQQPTQLEQPAPAAPLGQAGAPQQAAGGQ